MLVTLLVLTLLISALFLVRQGMKLVRLPAIWLDRFWSLLFVVLLLPFLPLQAVPFFPGETRGVEQRPQLPGEAQLTEATNITISDFSVSVTRFDLGWLESGLFVVWLGGIVLGLCLIFQSLFKLKTIIAKARVVKDSRLTIAYDACVKELGLKKKPRLLESDSIESPVTCGILRPYLLVPEGLYNLFSTDEIRYMFLHELKHHQLHHPRINATALLFQIVYWFHPLVWLARKKMVMDRELACDAAVIETIGMRERKAYGRTLLQFIEKKQSHSSLELGVGGTKKQIETRIYSLIHYRSSSKKDTVKGSLIYTLVVLFIVLQTPWLALGEAEEQRYSFDLSNASYEELSSFFADHDGSFVLYSARENHYFIHNRAGSEQRYSPNSTFKIYSALIGLEEGIVQPDTVLAWDGTAHDYPEWNQQQTLNSAMQYSVNWYFEKMEADMSLNQMMTYFNVLNYGNKSIEGPTPVWLESSLTISPVEQVDLLHRLYSNELPFQRESVTAVKDALLLEQTGETAFYGKTGTGVVNERAVNGWFVGFVETADDTLFFATHLAGDEEATGQSAADITRAILVDKGILTGGLEGNE
ncbi:BlaR1 family beta-lactam sensor/signal transducer [Bacillus sp. C1-1]|nr:BlaR1 family beta-lactam sensor/signal transducer [Bacillus sp. C1-1]